MPPFKLAALDSIMLDQAQNASSQEQQVLGKKNGWNQNDIQFSGIWSYSVSQKKRTPSVLVGELSGGRDGVLQLVQKVGTMDLVVVGNVGTTGCEFGSTVALFNWHIVKELFYKTKKNATDIQKFYIVVKNTDMFVLKKPKAPTSLSEESKRYRLKLLSKSALAFQYINLKHLSLSHFVNNKIFWGMATIMKLGHKGEVLEKWQRLLKISRENANLYPLLEVGDECELTIPLSHNPEVSLKKCEPIHSMNCVSENGYLSLPAEIVMKKVSFENIGFGEMSVHQVKNEGHHSDLITISGTVSCKKFFSAKFKSENFVVPHNVSNEHHIGVPRGMSIKLLLQDEKNPESEVWLYATCSTNVFIKGYPLCVLPGVRILATDIRIVTKNGKNVYLKTSDFTRIIPLSFPEPQQEQQADASSVPSEPVYFPLANISCCTSTFVTFARVCKVLTVGLKAVCKYCSYDMVKENYCCENCFGSSPDVKLSVELLVDDGTSTATILLTHVIHLAVLLGLSRKEHAKLYNTILSECLCLDYSATVLQSGKDSKDLKTIITHAGLEHSYKFTCKKQHSQAHLCLDVCPLKPLKDIEYILKNS